MTGLVGAAALDVGDQVPQRFPQPVSFRLDLPESGQGNELSVERGPERVDVISRQRPGVARLHHIPDWLFSVIGEVAHELRLALLVEQRNLLIVRTARPPLYLGLPLIGRTRSAATNKRRTLMLVLSVLLKRQTTGIAAL